LSARDKLKKMIDNQVQIANGNQNNNGREINHFIYRTWAVMPEAAPDAQMINVVATFDDTTYEVSTVEGVAGMIHVFVTPPMHGANPWTCSQHCSIRDITDISIHQIDGNVWAYVTYTDGTMTRSHIAPYMDVCEDVNNN